MQELGVLATGPPEVPDFIFLFHLKQTSLKEGRPLAPNLNSNPRAGVTCDLCRWGGDA